MNFPVVMRVIQPAPALPAPPAPAPTPAPATPGCIPVIRVPPPQLTPVRQDSTGIPPATVATMTTPMTQPPLVPPPQQLPAILIFRTPPAPAAITPAPAQHLPEIAQEKGNSVRKIRFVRKRMELKNVRNRISAKSILVQKNAEIIPNGAPAATTAHTAAST